MKSLLLFLALAATLSAEPALCTARIYSASEAAAQLPAPLRAALARDPSSATDGAARLTSVSYAQVDASRLALFHGQFWAWLFKQGIPTTAMRRDAGWPRFDCVDYSTGYLFRARLQHWQDDWRAPERTHPAMWRVGYKVTVDPMAPAPRAARHVIVFILTSEGPIFLDPQVGRVVLSESEFSSLYWPVE